QFAGVCYLVNSFALLIAPSLARALFPAILLPPFIGESALCLWLLFKGVDVPRWTEAAARRSRDGPRSAGTQIAHTTHRHAGDLPLRRLSDRLGQIAGLAPPLSPALARSLHRLLRLGDLLPAAPFKLWRDVVVDPLLIPPLPRQPRD